MFGKSISGSECIPCKNIPGFYGIDVSVELSL